MPPRVKEYDPVTGVEIVKSPYFTEDQVDVALLTLAKLGTYKRTADALAEVGIKVLPTTLQSWKRNIYPFRYAEISKRHSVEIDEVIVQRSRDAAIRDDAIAEQLADRLSDQVDRLDARDLAAAVKNMRSSSASSINTHLVVTGRPTQHVLVASVEENLRVLQSAGLVVDSTAEEDS